MKNVRVIVLSGNNEFFSEIKKRFNYRKIEIVQIKKPPELSSELLENRQPAAVFASDQNRISFIKNSIKIFGNYLPKIPFYVVTKNPSIKDSVKYIKLGADDYLDLNEKKSLSSLIKKNDSRLDMNIISDMFFKRVVENAEEGIWAIDENYVTIYANEKLGEIFDVSPLEMIGKPIYYFMDEDNIQTVKDFLENKHNGVKEKFDFNFKRKNGSDIFLHLSASQLIDAEKNYKGVIAFVNDITSKKKIERELLENENRYRTMFESNPVPMMVYSPSTYKILAVNDSAIFQYGYSEEEFLNLTIKDIRPEEDLPEFIKHISKIKKKYNKNDIWRHKKKNGTIFYVQVISHSLKYKGIDARLVIANDVTSHYTYQKEILNSETKYRILFEENPNSIWLLNKKNFEIVEVNKASMETYGYSKKEFLGKKFDDFLPSNYHAVNLIEKIDQKQKQFNVHQVIKSGQTINAEVYLHPIILSGIEYCLAMIIDITEKRKAEKEISGWKRRYELTVAASDQIVYDYVINSGEILWSGSVEKVLGYKLNEFLGGINQWKNLIHPEEKGEALALLEFAERNNKPYDFIYRFKNKNNEYLWMHHRGFFINVNGKPERMLGMIQNVNAKKIAEEENKKTKKKLQHLFDASPSIIYSAKIKNNNISEGWMSDNITRLLGYDPAEFSDFSRWIEIIHYNDRKAVIKIFKGLNSLKHNISEYQVKHKNGHYVWLRDEVRLLRDKDEIPKEIVGSLSEITIRKEIEKTGGAFAELGYKLSSAVSVREAALVIAETADKILGWEAISLDLYSKEFDNIIPALVIDTIDGKRKEFNNHKMNPNPSKRIKNVIDNGGQLILRKKNEHKNLELIPFGDIKKTSASILIVPIRKGNLCIGVLSVHSYEYDFYSKDNLDTLQRLADHCAGSLERLRVEVELEVSETKYSDIFNFAPTGIIQTYLDGKIITANKAFSNIMGYDSIEEILGINMIDFYADPKDRDILIEELKKEDHGQYELELKKKNGEIIWVSLNTHAVKNDKDDLDYFEGFINDISEQKKIGVELTESQKKYKELADMLPQTIFEADYMGKLTFVNQASYKMFDYDVEDFENGLNIFQMIDPKEHEKVKSNLSKILKGEAVSDREYNAIRKNGTKFSAEIFSNAIISEGIPKGIRGILIDITDRKKAIAELIYAKEKAEEANRLKTGFLSTMSHEIRTPLNAILGFNSVIRDIYYPAADEEIRQCFNSMEDAGMRLLNTITQVLDASRIEAKEFPTNIESLSLINAVEIAYNMLNLIAEKKALKIVKIFPENDIIIKGDEYCLNGVLINLITNAVKYSFDGEIKISLSESDKYGICTIADEGIGMSEEYQKHLFETFSQENIGMDRPFEGTGLGLALTKRYLEMMNGKIKVESKKYQGTKITFRLPKN